MRKPQQQHNFAISDIKTNEKINISVFYFLWDISKNSFG